MAIFTNKVRIKNNLDEESDVVTTEDSIQEKYFYGILYYRKEYNRCTNIEKKDHNKKLGFKN